MFATSQCPWSTTEAVGGPSCPPLLNGMAAAHTQLKLVSLEAFRGQSPTATPVKVKVHIRITMHQNNTFLTQYTVRVCICTCMHFKQKVLPTDSKLCSNRSTLHFCTPTCIVYTTCMQLIHVLLTYVFSLTCYIASAWRSALEPWTESLRGECPSAPRQSSPSKGEKDRLGPPESGGNRDPVSNI